MADVREAADFGTRLRRRREQRGMTLREMATRTKHSVAQLEALERNEIARLPGGIFLRAIVRAYAQEVGADPEALLQDFLATVAGAATSGATSPPTDYEKATTPRRSRRPAVLVLVVLLVMVASIWWAFMALA